MPDVTTDAARQAPPAATVIEGVVDGVDGARVRGWAWVPRQPDQRLAIEIHRDGRLLARGSADGFRGDLAAAGKARGHCAFSIDLDAAPAPGARIEITAAGDGYCQHLHGSPWLVATPPTRAAQPDVFPVPIRGALIRGSLDQCGPTVLRGWALWTDDRRELPELALYEGDHELLRCKADGWRADIAERLHRDGCCGFEAPLPDALRDGELHTLELRLRGSGEALLARAVRVRIAAGSDARRVAHLPEPLARAPVGHPLTLSVIVNFYNMRREAARTLTSLTRGYQREVPNLDYEVLCVDNGSDPPLDADWVAGFGPEFRLIRARAPAASPCAALNSAALAARGRYLAVMIDGAHVLTPGVFREAIAAWHEDPAAVVAVRHWFVGGDQRWLASTGYDRRMEDRLFERIHWPNNGYELFRIGAPIGEAPEPWLDGLTESNCLLLPTALFDRIGGLDAAFTDPGGGFANLDLWRRASHATAATLVALIGEASFHQFHAGTTTNVRDREKDLRVRRYARRYRYLRGREFEAVQPDRLRFRGNLATRRALGIRQRPLLPVDLPVTRRVRPGDPAQQFDEGAQRYLQSAWAECGLAAGVTWLGQDTGVAAGDLIAIQKIVHALRCDAVLAVGGSAGLVQFIATVLAGDVSTARLVYVRAALDGAVPAHVHIVTGDAAAPSVVEEARGLLGGAERVLVVLACPAATSLDAAQLHRWGALVSHRSWLICTGTVFGRPWLGYAAQAHLAAIHTFLASPASPFVIDRSANRQWLTACPDGFLRKTGGSLAAACCDASLDDEPCSGPPAGRVR